MIVSGVMVISLVQGGDEDDVFVIFFLCYFCTYSAPPLLLPAIRASVPMISSLHSVVLIALCALWLLKQDYIVYVSVGAYASAHRSTTLTIR